ncbi:MAG: hypothetical protein WC886_07490 [Saccharofermentanaceae bacterium]|jgi:hypothetical protein
MAKFKVGCSPITSEIYAGRVTENGMWCQKHNVTDTAPSAVAQHLLQLDQCIEFDCKGKKYKLQVVEVK